MKRTAAVSVLAVTLLTLGASPALAAPGAGSGNPAQPPGRSLNQGDPGLPNQAANPDTGSQNRLNANR